MPKFKIGDRVRVTRPADLAEGPGWTAGTTNRPFMDAFDGGIYTIEEYSGRDVVFSEDDAGYVFDERWCELVSAPYNQDPAAGNAKFDAGKVRVELLPWDALLGLAAVMTHGAQKYTDDNWKQPDASWRRYLGSMMRHAIAYALGEDTDPDSGLLHIDHVQTNAAFLAVFQRRKIGNDDRDKIDPELLSQLLDLCFPTNSTSPR